MPALGADMTEGTVLEWHVQPGDSVHRGQIVATVDTAKSAIDIEVFEDGVVEELLATVGTTVGVGEPIARITGTGRAEPAAPPPPGPPPSAIPHHRPSSPLARRRAAELGLELDAIAGTGRDGAVTMADVEAAAGIGATAVNAGPSAPPPAPPPAPPARSSADRSRAMREAIGQLMARSKREIPHCYLQSTIDMGRALAWLQQANSERPVDERILPAALLLKATAMAVHEVPEVNGFWIDGAFHPSVPVHLGVAVSLRGGGLIAPAIHDAAGLSLTDLMAALKDLALRARSGRLRASEMTDATITVTNLGDRGVDVVHGVIYPPQVALAGFGRIHEEPRAVDGMLTVRQVVIATLAADHRVSDGHRGGLFLEGIDAALQRPEEL